MLPSGLYVRYRVDGVLRKAHFGKMQDNLDQNMREITSRIRILSKLDIAERRRPQDGSFQVCTDCGFSGYKGRMMVADLWVPDEQDAGLVTRQAPFDQICQSAQRTTCSMAQDAHERLVAGTTTVEELLRVLPYGAIAEHRRRWSR